jgi:hypothetical protein
MSKLWTSSVWLAPCGLGGCEACGRLTTGAAVAAGLAGAVELLENESSSSVSRIDGFFVRVAAGAGAGAAVVVDCWIGFISEDDEAEVDRCCFSAS